MSGKAEERRHLRILLDRMKDPPKGETSFAEPNEVPDLRICTNQGVVGIEHQRLYYPRSQNGVIRQEQESLREQVVQRAKHIFESRSDVVLDVAVDFWTLYGLAIDPTDVKLTPTKVQPIAERVAALIQRNIPGVGETLRIQPSINEDDFPEQISSILVSRPKNKSFALWQSPEGGAVARFTPKFFRKHIAKKEEKIERYRKGCREVWLLMVADGSNFSSWFDRETSKEAFQQCYSTEFTRVFVLHGPSLRLEELDTQPQSEA